MPNDLFKKKPPIDSAAIIAGGSLFTARHHDEAIEKAEEAGADISKIDEERDGKFLTTDDRLIDREEAKEEFGITHSDELKGTLGNLFPKKSKMKSVEDVVACVIDYGTFISVAEKLAETMKCVYYYSPYEEEYQDVRECVKGTGLDKVKRCDDYLDPKIFDTIDLFIFPDIGFGGLQKHLRSLGKAVWGQMGANEIEIDRDYFLKVLKKVGLPIIESKTIIGMSALRDYLQKNENKWIKVNRYRRNMETWHHIDYAHSQRMLDSISVIFGSAQEEITFIVQDNIKSDMEAGYDGWCIDGKFPSYSFQGYEKKNELYLGSLLSNDELPEEIKTVNEAMAPVLKEYGYRDWWATEIRIADGIPYFIDPTPRMPGQTGEHQLETCTNLADIIWQGAQGILIEPEFQWKFAAEATLHYDALSDDIAVTREWKTLDLPKQVRRWLKLYHYCKIDGLYHFSPEKTDEVGVVIGVGNSIEESIEHLKENLEILKDLPVHANLAGFADLLESIEHAKKEGMKFADKVPKPKEMFSKLV